MSANKKVRINLTFDWWEAVVEVERCDKTTEKMKAQLLFWMNGQHRIDEEKGDIEKAYLKMLTQQLIYLSMEFNTFGIKEEMADMEGWYSIDGKHGVKLLTADTWRFMECDVRLEEKT